LIAALGPSCWLVVDQDWSAFCALQIFGRPNTARIERRAKDLARQPTVINRKFTTSFALD
jgi:hypothetical protein